MAADDSEKRKARAKVQRAQERFAQATGKARDERRQAFKEGQEEGLTLREIGEAAGLHHSSVAQIIDE
ncbi:MAG: hypothetical protein U0R71_03880 [Solirubrobacterales bacterium]